MELQQLRCFVAVAEELHFRRAAERLHLAQPAVSRTIRNLEARLRTQLFERNTRSVSLSPSGEALLGPARDALAAVERGRVAIIAAERGDTGEVRLAFAGLSAHTLVAALARAVSTELPDVRLELSSQEFARPAMERLSGSATDLALGRWDQIPGEIATRVLVEDSLVIALPGDHELATADCVRLEQLREARFISLDPRLGSVLNARLTSLGRAAGFVPHVSQVVPDTQTALALVGAQVGCHLTLASVAERGISPFVRFVPLTDTEALPDVHFRAAWRRADRYPALSRVLELLSQVSIETNRRPQ